MLVDVTDLDAIDHGGRDLLRGLSNRGTLILNASEGVAALLLSTEV